MGAEYFLRKHRTVIRYRKEIIESLKVDIATLESLLTSTSYKLSPVVVSSSRQDKMATIISRMDELEERMIEEGVRLVEEQREVEEYIQGLGTDTQSIMRCYYMDGLTWDEVAIRLHYSVRTLFRIRDRAIMLLDRRCH